MNPVVSVVVPVYNVEPFLDRCVQSIVDQDLREIEIILVDDGSTDNGPAMCDEWAKRDERIRVVHQANAGLSEARNRGIDESHAPWIGFVDSDDYIAPNMYSRLLAMALEHNAQMVVGGVRSVYTNREVIDGHSEKFVMNKEQAFKEFMHGQRVHIWVPVKLYARSLFDTVRFEKGRTYEDQFIIADLLAQCNTVAADLEPFYAYVHHEGTITTARYNPHTKDQVDAAEYLHSVVARECPSALPEADFRLAHSYFDLLDIIVMTGGPEARADRDRAVKFLRAHAKQILADNYTGRGRKIALRALRVSVGLYGLCVKAYKSRFKADEG